MNNEQWTIKNEPWTLKQEQWKMNNNNDHFNARWIINNDQ